MTSLRRLLEVSPADYPAQSARLAEALLQRTALVVAGAAHRIVELELYFAGGSHIDPFAHAHETQRTPGRWYFHRAGPHRAGPHRAGRHRVRQAFRGGSFKGLDLTFGAGGDVRGGVLIRTLRRPDGQIVCGPSLCVDALLAATESSSVAALDGALGHASGSAFDPRGAIHLADAPVERSSLLRTARVGLTLKRHTPGDQRPRYLMRPDRWLSDVRAVRKGRVHSVVALGRAGSEPAVIRCRTGSPEKSVAAWLAAYHRGRAARDFAPYVGRALKTHDVAALQGVWDALFGAG